MRGTYVSDDDMDNAEQVFRSDGPRPVGADRFQWKPPPIYEERPSLAVDGECRTCAKQGRHGMDCIPPSRQITAAELRAVLAPFADDAPVWLYVPNVPDHKLDDWDFMLVPVVTGSLAGVMACTPELSGSVLIGAGDDHDIDAAWEAIEGDVTTDGD